MLNFETWNKSDGNTLSIGCQIKNINNKYSENFCVITTPSNTELRVGPSFATDRYSSVATNLKDNICVLEVKIIYRKTKNPPLIIFCYFLCRYSVYFLDKFTITRFRKWYMDLSNWKLWWIYTYWECSK